MAPALADSAAVARATSAARESVRSESPAMRAASSASICDCRPLTSPPVEDVNASMLDCRVDSADCARATSAVSEDEFAEINVCRSPSAPSNAATTSTIVSSDSLAPFKIASIRPLTTSMLPCRVVSADARDDASAVICDCRSPTSLSLSDDSESMLLCRDASPEIRADSSAEIADDRVASPASACALALDSAAVDLLVASTEADDRVDASPAIRAAVSAARSDEVPDVRLAIEETTSLIAGTT